MDYTVTTYAWDYRNRLTSVTSVEYYSSTPLTPQTVTYTYLCPCQLAGADYLAAHAGMEKRVGGAGGDLLALPARRRGFFRRRHTPA
jgi:hypothetical protein